MTCGQRRDRIKLVKHPLYAAWEEAGKGMAELERIAGSQSFKEEHPLMAPRDGYALKQVWLSFTTIRQIVAHELIAPSKKSHKRGK